MSDLHKSLSKLKALVRFKLYSEKYMTYRTRFAGHLLDLLFHSEGGDTKLSGRNKFVNFLFSVENIEIPDRNSVSDSMTMVTTVRSDEKLNPTDLKKYFPFERTMFAQALKQGFEVFVKLTLDNFLMGRAYRDVENEIYKYYIDPILDQRLSPHFMRMIAYLPIDSVSKVFDEVTALKSAYQEFLAESVQRRTQIAIQKKLPLDFAKKAHAMFLEYGKGRSLKFLIDNKRLQKHELQMILFQIFYSLEIMNQQGLVHSDLHLGNIFVEYWEDRQKEKNLIYFVSKTEYYVVRSQKYMPRIFDWDRGWGAKVQTPARIESRAGKQMKNWGHKIDHHPTYDVYRIIMALTYFGTDELKKQMRQVIKDESQHLPLDHDVNVYSRMLLYDNKELQVPSDFVSLCQYAIDLDSGKYSCAGPLKIDSPLLQATFWMYHFAQNTWTKGKETFSKRSLPHWDPKFSPGTANWEECVFFLDNVIKDGVTTYIKNHPVTPIDFNKLK